MLNILEINDNFCDCLIRLFIFLGHIMNFIKILVPIIIIVMGSIDFIKAVIAQKDDEMKKSQSIFIKRLIYGIATFFVISIISFLIGLAGGDTNNRCFKCVANVNSKECDKDNIPVCKTESQTNETPNEVPPTTTVDPETPIVEEPSDEWDCSNIPADPSSTCKVKFSGSTLLNLQFFETDFVGEVLYQGTYNDFEPFIPNAHKGSLDLIIMNHDTKLIIYEKENFEGNVIFDDVGPMIIANKRRGKTTAEYMWPVREIIEKEGYKEIMSTWDMFLGEEVPPHDYTTPGSFKICCKK